MDLINAIILDFKTNLWVYLSMPIIASLIGYITKIVAIKMMFQPLEFIGIKPPYLGWQGIIPRRAEKMSSMACDIMTTRLISTRDIFSRLDSGRIAKEIEKPMLDVTQKITHEVMEHYQPGLWESLPWGIRELLIKRIQNETPHIVKDIMDQVKDNLDEIFDLKHMVVSNLVRDKALLNRIFYESGHKEFKFIQNSGIYFGFTIGIVQMLTWLFASHCGVPVIEAHKSLIMPFFGLFTGWFTDWLALKMIFNPKHPKTYFGIFKWHGLFLKRRKEVAADYGSLIAQEILTPSTIMNAVLTGPLSDNLFFMIQHHVKKAIDEQSGLLKPLVVLTVGSTTYQEMKKVVAQRMMDFLPKTLKHMEKYAEDAMDIRNTLSTKMAEMTEEEFESLLRPAFQQDEWILIAVGAVLGFLVGEFQVFFMLH
ncbi:MAG: DUF445 domain-containing protein [Desulfobacterales bacterium]|nr:DUF445 domain-containing protein [Desulfobacterales bacterium]